MIKSLIMLVLILSSVVIQAAEPPVNERLVPADSTLPVARMKKLVSIAISKAKQSPPPFRLSDERKPGQSISICTLGQKSSSPNFCYSSATMTDAVNGFEVTPKERFILAKYFMFKFDVFDKDTIDAIKFSDFHNGPDGKGVDAFNLALGLARSRMLEYRNSLKNPHLKDANSNKLQVFSSGDFSLIRNFSAQIDLLDYMFPDAVLIYINEMEKKPVDIETQVGQDDSDQDEQDP